MQVNYIKHLESIHSKFIEDNRINPYHISLYMALFHLWNSAMFPEQLSIARSEVMRYSKIGSVNTYTKCLKQLHAFGYIDYLPSKNPYVGSLEVFETVACFRLYRLPAFQKSIRRKFD